MANDWSRMVSCPSFRDEQPYMPGIMAPHSLPNNHTPLFVQDRPSVDTTAQTSEEHWIGHQHSDASITFSGQLRSEGGHPPCIDPSLTYSEGYQDPEVFSATLSNDDPFLRSIDIFPDGQNGNDDHGLGDAIDAAEADDGVELAELPAGQEETMSDGRIMCLYTDCGLSFATKSLFKLVIPRLAPLPIRCHHY